LSAAADVGWPDIFNSGVFVFKPSLDTYGKLIQFADSVGSFDGGDQGLLNQFFSDWSSGESSKRLPFLYNTASTATYSYLPAFKHFSKDVKIIHFIGETKPWSQQINTFTKQVQAPSGFSHLQDFLQTWWNLFCEKVHPQLSDQMVSNFFVHFYVKCVPTCWLNNKEIIFCDKKNISVRDVLKVGHKIAFNKEISSFLNAKFLITNQK
jgi:lipopolysaccharide biosynthesis glycosyltransferase